MVRIPRPFPRLLPRWPVGPCSITKHDTAHPAANFAPDRHCRIAGMSVLARQGLETSPPNPPVCNRPVKMNTIEEINDVEQTKNPDHGRARPPVRQHSGHGRRHAGDPHQQSRTGPCDDLRQGRVLQSGRLGEGPAGAQHHRGGRAQRRAEARPDRGRGDQRQHRHWACHGLRAKGLSAGRHHGRQLFGRAPQADAHAGRQGGADAARRKGLRHVQEGGGAGRGQWLVPRPPVRDRRQCRHPRGDHGARDHQ